MSVCVEWLLTVLYLVAGPGAIELIGQHDFADFGAEHRREEESIEEKRREEQRRTPQREEHHELQTQLSMTSKFYLVARRPMLSKCFYVGPS